MRDRTTFRRAMLMARRHGPTAPVWRKRAAILSGAIVLGLVALVFANAADWASAQFLRLVRLAVSGMPGSGTGAELLAWAGIDAEHIAAAARKLAGG